MIFNMLGGASDKEINHIVERIKECGYEAHLIRGKERTVIGVVGNSDRRREELLALSSAPGVEEIVRISHPYKLAARSVRPEGTVIDLGEGRYDRRHGNRQSPPDRAPWKLPSRLRTSPRSVAKAGAKLLRGGAFKPRSSPYSFQGLGEARPETPARRGRQKRPARRQRSDGPFADRNHDAVRGRAAGRRAQHAELSSAARARRSR